MDYAQIAKEILAITGPVDNILHIEHCMTRLRLQLKHKDTAMLTKLKKIPGVLGIHDTEQELQIILGPGRVNEVTSIFQKLVNQPAPHDRIAGAASLYKAKIGDGKELHEQIRARNRTPIRLFFKRISSIFIPLIPAFIACGLIVAILNVTLHFAPGLTASPYIKLLTIAGNSVFFGMNVFVGINSSKEFGGSPMLGGVLAVIITHPQLSAVTLFDEPLVPGRGGVIAVLFVTAFAAWLEKRLHHIIPEIFDLFLTPLLIILIAGSAALGFLQPLGGMISEWIGTAATTSISSGGAITGFLLGGTFLPMVMLGIHQALTPIHAELLARNGVTILLPVLAMAGAGQVGASMAVYLKTKNTFLKKTIISALPIGIMGVGEPLIYGVTLPLGRPFIAACIGGAFGGAVQASFVIGASGLGISGLPLAAITDDPAIYLAGLGTAYLTGFIATWLIGFTDPEETK